MPLAARSSARHPCTAAHRHHLSHGGQARKPTAPRQHYPAWPLHSALMPFLCGLWRQWEKQLSVRQQSKSAGRRRRSAFNRLTPETMLRLLCSVFLASQWLAVRQPHRALFETVDPAGQTGRQAADMSAISHTLSSQCRSTGWPVVAPSRLQQQQQHAAGVRSLRRYVSPQAAASTAGGAAGSAATAGPAPVAVPRAPSGWNHPSHSWMWRGHRVQYTTAGCGPPIVLVHGFGASSRHWRFNIGVLASHGYKVLALELSAAGCSVV